MQGLLKILGPDNMGVIRSFLERWGLIIVLVICLIVGLLGPYLFAKNLDKVIIDNVTVN